MITRPSSKLVFVQPWSLSGLTTGCITEPACLLSTLLNLYRPRMSHCLNEHGKRHTAGWFLLPSPKTTTAPVRGCE
jgi:hypothetical protein